MILESIKLHHVGPFCDGACVGPLAEGLNVLGAPNEIGKTTLLRAAARALFDRHTCRDEEIRALQPAGTSLTPIVTVVFRCGGRRYQVEKVFLLGPQSRLREWRQEGWQLLAEGDQADQRVQALLQSRFPGRGATTAAHWGLLGYLWARQGEPAAWPSWGGDAGRAIHHRLVRLEIDPLIDRLRAALWDTYLENFTPTGQTKAGGALKRLEEDLAGIEADLKEVARKREHIEQLEHDFHALTAEVTRLEQEHTLRAEEAARVHKAAEQAELLRTELNARENELEAARERLKAVNADLEAVEKTRQAQTTARVQLAAAQSAAAKQTRVEAESGLRLQKIERTCAETDEALARLRAEQQRVQDLLKLRQLRQTAEERDKQLKKARQQAGEVARLAEEKARLPDLSLAKLRRIEELAETVREKRAQVQSLGLTVELVPLNDARITVVQSGLPRTLAVGKGQIETVRAPQALELRLEGWGTIAVRSGAKELEVLAGELASTEEKLQELLVQAGVTGLEEARSVAAKRKEVEHQIRAADDLLAQILDEFAPLDRLQKETTAAQAKVHALQASLKPRADEETASMTDLETRDEELRTQIRHQEELRGKLAAELEEHRLGARQAADARQTAEKQAASLAATLEGLERQIAALEQRYPDGIEKGKQQAGQAFVEAEARRNDVKRKLPADFEKLPERNRRAVSALQQVEEALKMKRDAAQKAQGSLEALVVEGVYGRESELLEKQGVLLGQRDAARARGWAARLAHDLIERRKQAATRSVLAPLEARLTSAFAEVTGETRRHVFLDENLQVRGVGTTPDALVPFENLSQGAKEQLLLALRLAVAEELSAVEPHALILDDVLVNTDSVRQQRVLDLLEAASRKFQILVLTCHAERYRGAGHQVQIQYLRS
jgi:hypothetical protein